MGIDDSGADACSRVAAVGVTGAHSQGFIEDLTVDRLHVRRQN
jgi:hypothetical protein